MELLLPRAGERSPRVSEGRMRARASAKSAQAEPATNPLMIRRAKIWGLNRVSNVRHRRRADPHSSRGEWRIGEFFVVLWLNLLPRKRLFVRDLGACIVEDLAYGYLFNPMAGKAEGALRPCTSEPGCHPAGGIWNYGDHFDRRYRSARLRSGLQADLLSRFAMYERMSQGVCSLNDEHD